jgi:hypothetical protein
MEIHHSSKNSEKLIKFVLLLRIKVVTMSTQKWSPKGNQILTEMVNLQPLQKIVECTIYSPYIRGEKPISLLIVAKPESGKTSVLKMYRENNGIVYVTDCTGYRPKIQRVPRTGQLHELQVQPALKEVGKLESVFEVEGNVKEVFDYYTTKGCTCGPKGQNCIQGLDTIENPAASTPCNRKNCKPK